MWTKPSKMIRKQWSQLNAKPNKTKITNPLQLHHVQWLLTWIWTRHTLLPMQITTRMLYLQKSKIDLYGKKFSTYQNGRHMMALIMTHTTLWAKEQSASFVPLRNKFKLNKGSILSITQCTFNLSKKYLNNVFHILQP